VLVWVAGQAGNESISWQGVMQCVATIAETALTARGFGGVIFCSLHTLMGSVAHSVNILGPAELTSCMGYHVCVWLRTTWGVLLGWIWVDSGAWGLL
jgi:hypothetical protein